MNMTYARAKFENSPEVKKKLRGMLASRAVIERRVMVVSKSAATLPGPRKEPKRRSRRLRLNPARRTVAENRAAP